MLAPSAAVAMGKFKCTLNSLFGSSYKGYNSTLTIVLHCICPNLKLALILDKLPMRICASFTCFFCVFVGFNLGLKQICKVASGNLCMLSLLWPTSGVNNLMSSQTQSKLDFNISSFRYEFNIYVPCKKSQKNHNSKK